MVLIQPLKNEYQDDPGSKDSRCVRLTTYHLHVPIVKKSGALISWRPVGLFRPVMGLLTATKRLHAINMDFVDQIFKKCH